MSDTTSTTDEIKLNTICHGDCVAGLNALPQGCVDLVFADPPFNIGYDYDVYDDRRASNQYLAWSRDWISGVYHALKPNGTFWLAIGDEYAAELKVLSQEIGFTCRSWVVWYYTFGVNCKRKFSRSHAHLFHFVKDANQFTFRAESPENRLPSARQLVYGDRRANPTGRLPDDTWILRPQDLANCFTAAEDTWYFPRVAGTFAERAGFHGCQMPEQLLGRIIRVSSEENELVVDPFAGSATTLVVAKKLGRRFLGFDLSPEYVERGKKRLEQARRGDRLEGAPEPLLSAPATAQGRVLPGVKTTAVPRAGATPKAKAQPLFTAQATAEEQAERVLLEKLDHCLIDAFRQSHRGHSVDRLVADPELHEPFLARCKASGAPGDPRSWNLRLLELRRAGLLAEFPIEHVTDFDWAAADEYLFASEMAVARSLASAPGADVDELLAEPSWMAEFDELSQGLAEGTSAFALRWGALKLVRHAESARVRSVAFAAPRFSAAVRYTDVADDALPEAPGVYLVTSKTGETWYAGQTLNQRRRLARQFPADRLHAIWAPLNRRADLRFQFFNIDGGVEELLAYQSLLVRSYHPRLNLLLLGELGLQSS